MTKDQLKKYLDGVIDDIRTLYVKTQEKLREIQKKANSEWTTVYNIPRGYPSSETPYFVVLPGFGTVKIVCKKPSFGGVSFTLVSGNRAFATSSSSFFLSCSPSVYATTRMKDCWKMLKRKTWKNLNWKPTKTYIEWFWNAFRNFKVFLGDRGKPYIIFIAACPLPFWLILCGDMYGIDFLDNCIQIVFPADYQIRSFWHSGWTVFGHRYTHEGLLKNVETENLKKPRAFATSSSSFFLSCSPSVYATLIFIQSPPFTLPNKSRS